MKGIVRTVVLISITMVLIIMNYGYGINLNYQEEEIMDLNLQASDPYNEPYMLQIDLQQSKGQISFFQQAIDQLGTTSIDKVVELWVEAERTRNGVYQYGVASPEQKAKLINERGEPTDKFWIIGGSSPWLTDYEEINRKKLDEETFEVQLKYYWGTSAGATEPTFTTLIVGKFNEFWKVKEVR
ncbi:hypothetical protein [Alkaliphilus transvaalensis]|uniref:hypothetical protein n=1 Tax=Alkaliphilus transvaalensis TaxID=114628 RepID=UPI00047BAED7|nr:hypothetical protein [Alkaliphilus transvaalensis]